MQLACRASDKVHIERQVHAYFPEVAIAVAENVLREIWGAAGSAEWVVVDFGLSEEFMLPIRTFSGFDPDRCASWAFSATVFPPLLYGWT